MSQLSVILTVAFLLATGAADVSIYDTNMNAVQASDAINCFAEASVMWPDNEFNRIQAFSELFGAKYNGSKWNVASTCASIYTPSSKLYCALKVNGAIIRIFN